MQDSKNKTAVYIDGANLHFAVKMMGADLDYKRFYVWLSDNFKTRDIHLFTGYLSTHQDLYAQLSAIGFKLTFKKVLQSKGKIKGNCDAELVLKAATDILRNGIKELVLVSSDGDFACLLGFAKKEVVKTHIISPSKKLSFLIKTLNMPTTYLKDIITLVSVESEKAPGVH